MCLQLSLLDELLPTHGTRILVKGSKLLLLMGLHMIRQIPLLAELLVTLGTGEGHLFVGRSHMISEGTLGRVDVRTSLPLALVRCTFMYILEVVNERGLQGKDLTTVGDLAGKAFLVVGTANVRVQVRLLTEHLATPGNLTLELHIEMIRL
jgi:hypothetical protein